MVQRSTIKLLSEKERKIISSLRLAKRRSEEQLFVAEGAKCIELLSVCFKMKWLVAHSEKLLPPGNPMSRLATEATMKKLSALDSRQDLLAVFEIPKLPPFERSGLTIALDGVQNPGNLGTIIRLCDWLGIKNIIASKGTVDPYNPKVVQASMGALGNVCIYHDIDLARFLPQHFEHIIATTMDGSDYRETIIDAPSVIVLGNEGEGISAEVLEVATTNITIPKSESSISESLNVSISAAIMLSTLIK